MDSGTGSKEIVSNQPHEVAADGCRRCQSSPEELVPSSPIIVRPLLLGLQKESSGESMGDTSTSGDEGDDSFLRAEDAQEERSKNDEAVAVLERTGSLSDVSSIDGAASEISDSEVEEYISQAMVEIEDEEERERSSQLVAGDCASAGEGLHPMLTESSEGVLDDSHTQERASLSSSTLSSALSSSIVARTLTERILSGDTMVGTVIDMVQAGIMEHQREVAERAMRQGDMHLRAVLAGATSLSASLASSADGTVTAAASSHSGASVDRQGPPTGKRGKAAAKEAAVTVRDLKREIEKERGILKARQRLLYQGQELDDEQPLAFYDIRPGGVVFLLLRKVSAVPFHISVASLGSAGGGAGGEESSPAGAIHLQLEMTADCTVGDVKEDIEEETGVAVDNQVLVFGGKQLTDDEKALCEYGIGAGAKVFLVLSRPRDTRIHVLTPSALGPSRREKSGRETSTPRRLFAEGLGGPSSSSSLDGTAPRRRDDGVGVEGGLRVDLDVNLRDSVSDLKSRLARRLDMDGGRLVLMYAGKPLDETQTLAECGVRSGADVRLGVKMKTSK